MAKSNISLSFVGLSSTDVTNSAYLIQANNLNILMDFGLYQDNDIRKDYVINRQNSKKLKPKKIDAIIISHSNIDHIGKLPYLYKNGCKATTYVPKGNFEIVKILLENSAKIMESDADKLKFKHKMSSAKPLYDLQDVEKCLLHIKEIPYHSPIPLGSGVVFEYYGAGHIIASAQILVTITDKNGVIKRIGYTGDIGSKKLHTYYKKGIEKLPYCDVLIGESTYCGNTRNHTDKDIVNDKEKLKRIFEDTLDRDKAKILIPVFSLDRLQKILTFIYKTFGENLKHNIYVDSPLGHKISEVFEKGLINQSSTFEEINMWHLVHNWDKVHYIDDYKDSMILQRTKEPMIILAGSGMLTQGRGVEWVKWLLPQEKNTICFCGYSGKNTLATEIKDKALFVKIGKNKIKNKANICVLNSFSSHACRQELIDYYTELKFNKLYLVHGDIDDRREFVNVLEQEFFKHDKSSKVYIPSYETTIHI